MSIARAFTKRSKHPDLPELLPSRFASIKKSSSSSSSSSNPSRSGVSRSNTVSVKQISSPVALISTTNMLSYNAPSVAAAQHHNSTLSHSTSSTFSSTRSLSNASSASSNPPDLVPDTSSVESSPTSPAPNHLSAYFNTSTSPSPSISKPDSPLSISPSPTLEQQQSQPPPPAIPARALSHSKRAHEQLARKRSLITRNFSTRRHNQHAQDEKRARAESPAALLLPLPEGPRTREQRSSFEIMAGDVDHPFGSELEQLNEVAEEFGGTIRDASMEEDLAFMKQHGLVLLSASDYVKDIQPLFSRVFEPHATYTYPYHAETWI